MRLWIVAVLVLASCGPNKDDVNCSYDESDRMNAKGEAPAGSCNICAPSCEGPPFGFWVVERDDPMAKLEIGKPPECSVVWVSLDRSDDREGIEADMCEE